MNALAVTVLATDPVLPGAPGMPGVPGARPAAGPSVSELLADDPWWLVLLKAGVLFAFMMVITLFNIVFERKVVSYMQHRIGPNRVGPWGALQSLADGVKLALKEDIIPKAADKVVFVIAPVIAVTPALMSLATIPFGPKVTIFGEETALQLTDMPVGVLYVLAVASIGIYGIVLAGWSSGSTYPLLGGLRSSAQMISYEVAMSLSFAAVFLYAGSMSTSDIVTAQSEQMWFALALAPSFVIYLVAMVGETNRAPFDLPEAEGELVGGFHTEYSSLKFALFFLAEYVNMVTVSAVATTLFLGGWRAPWPTDLLGGAWANEGWWPVLWFLGKVIALIFVFVWLRGTLPRLRYDQFMKLGWKVLIPLSLVWVVLVATVKASRNQGYNMEQLAYWGGGVLIVLLLASFALDAVKAGRERSAEQTAGQEPGTPDAFDPMAAGYPVPPMPGQKLPEYRRRARRTVNATTVPAGATAAGAEQEESGA